MIKPNRDSRLAIRDSSFFHQQRKKRPRANSSEQNKVQLHGERQGAQRGVRRGTAGNAPLCGRPRLADGPRVRLRRADRRSHPARRAPRHRALRDPHQDVLDKAADDWRVVPDAANTEARGVRDLFELRNITQRVQVVRLAQVFLAQIDQAPSVELTRKPVDPAQADEIRA